MKEIVSMIEAEAILNKWRIWYRAKNGIYTRSIEVLADTRQRALQIFNKIKPLNKNEVRDIYSL